MRPRYYVDTSAYLCILLRETGHAGLSAELNAGQLFSSSLLVLEAERNLVRLARTGGLAPKQLQVALDRLEQDVAYFTFRDLTLDLCRMRTMPVVSTPRSLDLVHLRTAAWFHSRQPLARFVTLDAAMRATAQELALPV